MHRTEGEDYILDGTKRLYAEADLPAQKATRLPAAAMNAIQEEICSVIEAAGITLSADSATDTWNQLLEALTQHGLIGTNALANGAVTSSKIATNAVFNKDLLTNEITWTGGANDVVTSLQSGLYTTNVETTGLPDPGIIGAYSIGETDPNSIQVPGALDGQAYTEGIVIIGHHSQIIGGSLTYHKTAIFIGTKVNAVNCFHVWKATGFQTTLEYWKLLTYDKTLTPNIKGGLVTKTNIEPSSLYSRAKPGRGFCIARIDHGTTYLANAHFHLDNMEAGTSMKVWARGKRKTGLGSLSVKLIRSGASFHTNSTYLTPDSGEATILSFFNVDEVATIECWVHCISETEFVVTDIVNS